jgi:hypothetical protein
MAVSAVREGAHCRASGAPERSGTAAVLSERDVVVSSDMVKTLEQALVEVATLPDADQEEIGRRLLSHVEKLRRLRDELDKGARSLDAGKGTKFSIEEFIRQKTR